jgi:hypothetical protein
LLKAWDLGGRDIVARNLAGFGTPATAKNAALPGQGVPLSRCDFDRSGMLPVAISLSQDALPRAEASQR